VGQGDDGKPYQKKEKHLPIFPIFLIRLIFPYT
jgi:hypothetical protein